MLLTKTQSLYYEILIQSRCFKEKWLYQPNLVTTAKKHDTEEVDLPIYEQNFDPCKFEFHIILPN